MHIIEPTNLDIDKVTISTSRSTFERFALLYYRGTLMF